MNTRSGFRGRLNLIFCSYIDKLILKTGYDPKNEMKYFNNFSNFSNTDDCILKFFFYFYSIYYFRIPEVIFIGARRRRFD